MPSWELFRAQPIDYQLSVFPEGVPVLAVEAASVVGWQEYAHAVVGMSTFGASAPYKEVYKRFGFTTDNIANKARQVVDFYSKHPCGSKVLKPF
jgi:transketolase